MAAMRRRHQACAMHAPWDTPARRHWLPHSTARHAPTAQDNAPPPAGLNGRGRHIATSPLRRLHSTAAREWGGSTRGRTRLLRGRASATAKPPSALQHAVRAAAATTRRLVAP
eukprot:scaffold1233_cov395-Prasinococcus_capsulatus_cf.AAC.28